jgi:chemotaxis signal transduction protein
VDVRGRAIPVVDLRADASRPGEVLLPLYRHHVGLVVDRVLAVRRADELVAEPDAMADLLPPHATGVLRAVDGSGHLLLVAMPELASFSP